MQGPSLPQALHGCSWLRVYWLKALGCGFLAHEIHGKRILSCLAEESWLRAKAWLRIHLNHQTHEMIHSDIACTLPRDAWSQWQLGGTSKCEIWLATQINQWWQSRTLPGYTQYEVHFDTNWQTNIWTGKGRKVRFRQHGAQDNHWVPIQMTRVRRVPRTPTSSPAAAA